MRSIRYIQSTPIVEVKEIKDQKDRDQMSESQKSERPEIRESEIKKAVKEIRKTINQKSEIRCQQMTEIRNQMIRGQKLEHNQIHKNEN